MQKALLEEAAPAPDTLVSTCILFAKGLVVCFLPFLVLTIFSPAVRGSPGSIFADMSLGSMTLTFGTYMLSDFLSNFIQHPTQKMDYGFFNKFIGREADQVFWGTRTSHIVGVAAGLALLDEFSEGFFGVLLGEDLSFAATPGGFVAHTVFFIYTGVAVWVLVASAFDPGIAPAERWSAFMGEAYATYIGASAAWFEPFVGVAVASLVGEAAGHSWLGGSLLPATLAYAAVKGFGWNDWGNSGLNDLEKKLNDI